MILISLLQEQDFVFLSLSEVLNIQHQEAVLFRCQPVLHLKCPLIVLKVISLLAEFIAARSGKSSTLNSDKYKIMKQRNWQCDIIPTINELGYAPEYDLEKGVHETIAWYKNEGWL